MPALYPVGTTCRASKCDMTTDAFTPEFKCDGTRRLREQPRDRVRALQVQGRQRLLRHLHRQHPVRDRQELRERLLRPQAEGRDLHRGHRVRRRELRRRRLLRQALPGRLRVVQPADDAVAPAPPSRPAWTRRGSVRPGPPRTRSARQAAATASGGTACRKADTSAQCRAGTCVAGVAVNPATCQTNGVCPAHRPDSMRRLHSAARPAATRAAAATPTA